MRAPFVEAALLNKQARQAEGERKVGIARGRRTGEMEGRKREGPYVVDKAVST